MTASPDRSEIITVPFEKSHAEDAAKIEAVCFSHPWSFDDLYKIPDTDNAVYFTALCDDRPIGYAGMYVAAEFGMINNIAIHPGYRRRGAASMLIGELVSYAEKNGISRLMLEVRTSNTAAVSLYEKEGFVKVGTRKNYYEAPVEDAALYTKEIKCFI